MKSLKQVFKEAVMEMTPGRHGQGRHVINLDIYTEKNPNDVVAVEDELKMPYYGVYIDRKSYSPVGPGGGNPNANILGSKENLVKWMKEVYSGNDPEVYRDVISSNGSPQPWKG